MEFRATNRMVLTTKNTRRNHPILRTDANKLINNFYANWRIYFATLGKTPYDFDDWSDPDLEIWDIFRAVEEYLLKMTNPNN